MDGLAPKHLVGDHDFDTNLPRIDNAYFYPPGVDDTPLGAESAEHVCGTGQRHHHPGLPDERRRD